jgi:hypothetical protein
MGGLIRSVIHSVSAGNDHPPLFACVGCVQVRSECPLKTVAQLISRKGAITTEIEFMYPGLPKRIKIPFYNHVLIDFCHIGTYVTPEKIIHYFKENDRG